MLNCWFCTCGKVAGNKKNKIHYRVFKLFYGAGSYLIGRAERDGGVRQIVNRLVLVLDGNVCGHIHEALVQEVCQ